MERNVLMHDCMLLLPQSAAKRFKVTGTGKVMARHAGKQHFNEKMTRDKIRSGGAGRGALPRRELRDGERENPAMRTNPALTPLSHAAAAAGTSPKCL